MEATFWLPVVYFKLWKKRPDCSWTIEGEGQNQRLRGRSSGNHSLDLLLPHQRIKCFQRNNC